MLLSLMDGRALTASELALSSGITKQTASSHLAKLLDGGLLFREIQGRHHYYRLDDMDVAQAIEALLSLAERKHGKRTRTGPTDPALRKARICYDHLAGELGVMLFDRMSKHGWVIQVDGTLCVSQCGWQALQEIGITQNGFPKTKRPLCKTCLDWSMRRHHLAGQVGASILSRFFEVGWAKRLTNTRIIKFSKDGEASLRAWIQ